MIKKLRDKAKGKKGFTLVELIVVIVIILILAAVMVPQLLRYVDRAREANAKAEAATILSQVQADFADFKVDNPGAAEFPEANYNVNGVTVTRAATATPGTAGITVTTTNQEDSITAFVYNDGTYTAAWTSTPAAGDEAWTMTRVTQ